MNYWTAKANYEKSSIVVLRYATSVDRSRTQKVTITSGLVFRAFMEMVGGRGGGLLLTYFPGSWVVLLGRMNEGRASTGRVNKCKPIKHAHMWVHFLFSFSKQTNKKNLIWASFAFHTDLSQARQLLSRHSFCRAVNFKPEKKLVYIVQTK